MEMAIERQTEKNAAGSHASWEDVFLTPLDESDIDSLHEWQNSPDLRDLTMGFRFPIQKSSVKEWLQSIKEENSKSRIVFAIRLKKIIVGTISLHNIEQYQRKSQLGIYIGAKAQRGNGIGFISTSLLLDYAFNGLDFRKVNLEVIESNANAALLYERIGFQKEGTKRQEYFIDGKYIDTNLYGILRDEFSMIIPKQANRLLYTI